jgi:UPF0755 protein
VAYQLLTGARPFERDQGMAVLFAHLSQPPPSLVSRRPGLPVAADQVLAKALAKAPERRYGSCGEFADALREALGLAPYHFGAPAPASAPARPRPQTTMQPRFRGSAAASTIDAAPNGSAFGDDHEAGDRFVPGFGDDEDPVDPGDPRGRSGRGTRSDRGGGRPVAGRLPGRPAGSRGSKGPKGSKRPRRRGFRWIAPWAATLIILIPLAVAGAYGYSFIKGKYYPADYSGAGTGYVLVQVHSGDTPTSLGPELQKLGVVASARAFVLAVEHSSEQNGLLPGFYRMRRHMQASLAYALLLDPKNLVLVTVTIPEGWRLGQIVAWLGAKSGISASAYDTVLKDPAQLDLPSYAKGNPEGYLFPATYEVEPHETALDVLAGMVQRFDQEAASVNLPQAASRAHLTPDQVIIMASLVQAEGRRLSDYPKIARVIYNRLAQGIPLQLDSTVLFGLNTYGIIASDQQLTSMSPYNTYRYTGLTPGPIDNPGDAAIQAVLHPASGSWLYFVTVDPKTGETLFTSSEAQFQQYRAQLEKNLGKD